MRSWLIVLLIFNIWTHLIRPLLTMRGSSWMLLLLWFEIYIFVNYLLNTSPSLLLLSMWYIRLWLIVLCVFRVPHSYLQLSSFKYLLIPLVEAANLNPLALFIAYLA